ncbi:RusA family crossover junction endodeoxyribonuclease [Microvirga sp. KLBC 81]|uniref:RusA family crossover junction endodeoxyribonuclease n=1 Tax=Microvirga sp. KLBC 81 TaxID=1862707 RepID=UPI000D51E5D7|nr:RusA family crossover junction endodeoxyribonuclease [Microvirga sp. KLBC 81]PVE25404.1 RusA family crossover junction endodeoxyribonuclease [Microvirga sp. KLBC 81]
MTDLGRISIRLAGEPVGKGRPRFSTKSGRAFTPSKTRSYEAQLKYAAQQAMGERAPLDGPLSVRVVASFPVPQSFSKKKRELALVHVLRPTKVPDCDNLLKTLDALNEVVWRDDKQIVDALVQKVYSDMPGLLILVEPLPC